MENDVIDALHDVGYEGPILEEGGLEKALEGITKSVEFRKAVVWLAAELKILCKLDEQVNDISTPEEAASFLLELSIFLKEIGCQYKFLTEGHVSERLQSKKNALLLLHYLVTELQAARMVAVKQPSTCLMEIKLQESSTASELKNMLIALKFPKPPDNIQPSQLFSKVEERLKEVVSRTPPDLVSQPLFQEKLTDKQWHQLESIQKDLHEEYRTRREMLIKRLDVTIQSFQWSDRVKQRGEEIASAMVSKRKAMSSEPNVRLSSLLAARVDLAILEKTSSASVCKNTQSQLNKVIIGQVPDRGGRTTDQAPPPPEMPSWQKDRSAGGGGGGGGRGRGGGPRGGRGGHGGGDRNRVQGGWNQGQGQGQGGWNQGNQGHQGRDRDQAGGWNRNSGGNDRDRDQGGGWNRNSGGNDRDRGHGGGWNQGDRKGGGGGGGGGHRDQRYYQDQGDYQGGRNRGRGGGRRDDNYR